MEIFTINANSDLERKIIKLIPVDKRLFDNYICEYCNNRYEMCQCGKKVINKHC